MTIWFTSDTHFGHKMMAARRGFTEFADDSLPDVKAHDEAIISNWNRLVKPDDLVWILGDVGMSNQTTTLTQVANLNGRKQLITGNHDPVWPGHRDSRKYQHTWFQVFESVQAFAKIRLGDQMVLLSHFPYEGDHTENDRATQFRLRDEGLPLIHGHLHCEETITGSHSIHVGLDAWQLAPVRESTIMGLLRNMIKPGMLRHHVV
jgi:calcineurin-like phosphoesterase family protein